MDKKNKGEVHNTPAISLIGPRIKGIHISQDDKIKMAIRKLRESDQQEFDTFEEADDFEVDEDDTPLSGYENEFEDMAPDLEMEPIEEKKEEEKEKSAQNEAPPQEGADDKTNSD